MVAAFVPGRLGLGARIYALVLCVTALVLALIALRRAFPSETPLRESRRALSRPRPPASLARIEHEAALAVASSFELHYRFAPRLRSIAAGLLMSRKRVSLAAQPAAARDALGDPTWELVRPDRPAPEDRLARGTDDARTRARRGLAGVRVAVELAQVRELSGQVLDEVEKAVVGKREPLELVLLGFLE